MLRVMTFVGTRPEIIKLSRVIHELEQYTDHILIHTGQNYDYELNEVFFKEMGIKRPDYFLEAVGKTTAETIGNIIAKSDIIMAQEKPDAVLLYGDTNSCLSVISAKRRKIPVFHMEAGNRCFDQRVPEEINRKIVDHLSDINMPLTEHARRYLISEGIRPETIIKTGSCIKEILLYHRKEIESSDVLNTMDLERRDYFVLSAHREENVDSRRNFSNLISSINRIAEVYNRRIIFSTHPRTMKRINSDSSIKINSLVEIMKPLGYFDYIKLQENAFCVLSDSGTITEESSILDFPAVTIREAHERPEGMDVGTLIMSGLDPKRIVESINIMTSQFNGKDRVFDIADDYKVENVSKKVVRIIQSYTEYVNQKVWHKYE